MNWADRYDAAPEDMDEARWVSYQRSVMYLSDTTPS